MLCQARELISAPQRHLSAPDLQVNLQGIVYKSCRSPTKGQDLLEMAFAILTNILRSGYEGCFKYTIEQVRIPSVPGSKGMHAVGPAHEQYMHDACRHGHVLRLPAETEAVHSSVQLCAPRAKSHRHNLSMQLHVCKMVLAASLLQCSESGTHMDAAMLFCLSGPAGLKLP